MHTIDNFLKKNINDFQNYYFDNLSQKDYGKNIPDIYKRAEELLEYQVKLKTEAFECRGCAVKSILLNTSSAITNDFEVICWECPSINCNKINVSKIKDNQMGYMLITPKEILNFEIEKIKDNCLKELIQEFYYAVSLTFLSSATMLGRKILMHIAVIELNAKEKDTYVSYVEFIKNDNLLGRKWNEKIDIIRKLGNEENHEIKIANQSEIKILSEILTELIKNVYFVE